MSHVSGNSNCKGTWQPGQTQPILKPLGSIGLWNLKPQCLQYAHCQEYHLTPMGRGDLDRSRTPSVVAITPFGLPTTYRETILNH